MDWQIRLITIYEYIHREFNAGLWVYCQRFSNNNNPKFTDTEVMTVFLNGILSHRFNLKDIYNHTRNHLPEWFPELPSYPTFIVRLNRLEDVFPCLTERLQEDFSGPDIIDRVRLTDSFPVILASGRRNPKSVIAREFGNKGFCSSKRMYYHGIKIHILAKKCAGQIPVPDCIAVSPASDHDLTVFRQIAPCLRDCETYADKAYFDEIRKQYLKEQGVKLFTPVKKEKGQQHLFLFEQLLSTGVSRVRQPIESLFNWLQEHTGIQIASKVRSLQGLMVHVWGRLTAAMFMLVFNS